jgi:uncharacterized protein YbjT (DUF2867 family)
LPRENRLCHRLTRFLLEVVGATGFIGFRVLVEALGAGYKVRAAVRSESKAALLKAHELVQPYVGQLETVIVPDITVEGALDEALKDVVYVEHMVSRRANPVSCLSPLCCSPAFQAFTRTRPTF